MDRKFLRATIFRSYDVGLQGFYTLGCVINMNTRIIFVGNISEHSDVKLVTATDVGYLYGTTA